MTLAFAGDVMLGRGVGEAMLRHGFSHPWGDVLPLVYSTDLFLANLDCCLTSNPEPWNGGSHKGFSFRAAPAAVEALSVARVDFVSLANNHIADAKTAGLFETIEALDGARIAHAGAGANVAAAREPAVLGVGGWAVSVMSAADHPAEWAARASTPGINFINVTTVPDDFALVEAAIAEARARSDLVIFSMHWGPDMQPRPTEEFRQFARQAASVGADIFWGHGAQIVQAVEFWEGKLIMYDTGDFIDDYAIDNELRNDLSALFLVRVESSRIVNVRVVPVRIENMQVRLARGEDAQWFQRRFTVLCSEMGTPTSTDDLAVSISAPAPPVAMPE